MSQLFRLPKFHSNLVYQRPSNVKNLESLRDIYPSLYDEEVRPRPLCKENSCDNIRPKPYVEVPSASYITDDTTDFATDSADLQDYGSEARDFIISCLESSLVSTKENLDDTPDATSSDFSQKLTDEPKKSPTRSRLPLPIVRKKSLVPATPVSGKGFLSTIKESEATIPVVNKLETLRSDRATTKWFGENKLQFTKKMTSYTFTQYDFNGVQNFKNDSTLFGYSS